MRIDLELVLNHVCGGVEKVNAMNYLSRTPPPSQLCYDVEDAYAVNDQTLGRDFSAKYPRF